MRTVTIRTNTIERENYDADGNSFSNLMPEFAYRSSLRVFWYLYTKTPGANELGVDVSTWTKDTSYAGCSALLSCDNDWIRKVSGTLKTAVSAGAPITQIETTIENVEQATIPQTGTIILEDSTGNEEEYAYTARLISSENEVTFYVSATPVHSFTEGNTIRASQEMLFQAAMLPAVSDPANGMFAFDVVVASKKLSKLAEASASRAISNVGLELLPFSVDASNVIHELPAFLHEKLGLTVTIADPHSSPQISTELENTIAAIVSQKTTGFMVVPENAGVVAQVLTKTATGYKWATGGGGGGTTDYDLLENRPKVNNKTVEGSHNGSYYGLIDAPDTAGTNGQVLTKTTAGVEWKDPGSLYWQE